MKNTYFFFILAFSILLTGSHPQPIISHPIQTLAQVAKVNQLSINGWEVTMKETIQYSSFDQLVNKIRNSHLVSRIEDENSIKYDFNMAENTAHIELDMRMIQSKNSPGQFELIAVLRGTSWSETIMHEYEETYAQLMEAFFQNEPGTFTCIKLSEDDTIENRAVMERLTQSLQMKHVEEQYDPLEMSKHKKVVYGYTPLWNEKFLIQGIPYNVQIAATQDVNGELAYTIGTPILMNEY